MATLSWVLWGIILLLFSYWLVMAMAAIVPARRVNLEGRIAQTRFALSVPAHDEEAVIASTIQRLLKLDYPRELFQVYVVADHCQDRTAAIARQAGAEVFERNSGPRCGKSGALLWLFEQILQNPDLDAVVVFDADTLVEESFLRVMDARLAAGTQVVQGQHVIANPEDGWFPGLTWAMFLIDNRFQNLGRCNLGWSAKHMGDSICFRADVLRCMGCGEGLTEDYQLRQNLLLAGKRIDYEPAAIGYGEAPITWNQAKAQRARWLKGTQDANRNNALRLLAAGLRSHSFALFDGALQAVIPSFSTLSLLSVVILFVQIFVNLAAGRFVFPQGALLAWGFLIFLLIFYPVWGLMLEKAPIRAYWMIFTGPIFILWRTLLALRTRLGWGPKIWVHTQHGRQGRSQS